MNIRRDQDFRRYFSEPHTSFLLRRHETSRLANSQEPKSYLLTRFLGDNRFQTRDDRYVSLNEDDMDTVWQGIVRELQVSSDDTQSSSSSSDPTENQSSSFWNCLGVVLFIIAIFVVASIAASSHGSLNSGNESTNASASNSNTSLSDDTASSAVQQYYAAINNKDYHTAYNMWYNNSTGTGQSYEQFVAGYSNTRQDDITVDSVTSQDDSTFTVEITIRATESDQTETFHASYLVKKIGDSWKIMDGSIQKVG